MQLPRLRILRTTIKLNRHRKLRSINLGAFWLEFLCRFFLQILCVCGGGEGANIRGGLDTYPPTPDLTAATGTWYPETHWPAQWQQRYTAWPVCPPLSCRPRSPPWGWQPGPHLCPADCARPCQPGSSCRKRDYCSVNKHLAIGQCYIRI